MPNNPPTSQDGLLKLAERCEQAAGPDRELSASIALAVHDWLHEVEGNKPLNCRLRNKLGSPVYIGGEVGRAMDYAASLDAAMTLAPGGWYVSALCEHPDRDFAAVDLSEGADEENVRRGSAATPALALCAAALRARASQMNAPSTAQGVGDWLSPPSPLGKDRACFTSRPFGRVSTIAMEADHAGL